LWLEASVTNNDPSVIAEYYCDYIKQVSGAPRIVRAMKVRKTAMLLEFNAFSEGMVLIPSLAIKVLCMGVQYPTRG